MLTNIKSESNAPFLRLKVSTFTCYLLVCTKLFFSKKSQHLRQKWFLDEKGKKRCIYYIPGRNKSL